MTPLKRYPGFIIIVKAKIVSILYFWNLPEVKVVMVSLSHQNNTENFDLNGFVEIVKESQTL